MDVGLIGGVRLGGNSTRRCVVFTHAARRYHETNERSDCACFVDEKWCSYGEGGDVEVLSRSVVWSAQPTGGESRSKGAIAGATQWM